MFSSLPDIPLQSVSGQPRFKDKLTSLLANHVGATGLAPATQCLGTDIGTHDKPTELCTGVQHATYEHKVIANKQKKPYGGESCVLFFYPYVGH